MLDKIWNLFNLAGIVAYPLLAFSIVGATLIIERIYFWIRLYNRQNRVIRQALNIYREDNYSAIDYLKKRVDLPISRIFLQALLLDNPTPEEFRLALETATQAELPNLKKFHNIFETIITLSPLLGLLGTILGLMSAFSVLNSDYIAGGKSSGVSAGIGEALVSTVMGLVVAISIVFFSNIFYSLYLRQVYLIQEYGGQLELLYRRDYDKKEYKYINK
jgi:biopolymer transport protein ExbB